MENFYIIVVVVAVVALILCLVAVGISLQKKNETSPFPKLQAPCPDGWAIDGSNCTVNTINAGVLEKTNSRSYYDSADLKVWQPSTSNTFVGVPTATICDKRKWAIDKGINWDGVSNYNQCT